MKKKGKGCILPLFSCHYTQGQIGNEIKENNAEFVIHYSLKIDRREAVFFQSVHPDHKSTPSRNPQCEQTPKNQKSVVDNGAPRKKMPNSFSGHIKPPISKFVFDTIAVHSISQITRFMPDPSW